jgi:hypothetical protein
LLEKLDAKLVYTDLRSDSSEALTPPDAAKESRFNISENVTLPSLTAALAALFMDAFSKESYQAMRALPNWQSQQPAWRALQGVTF